MTLDRYVEQIELYAELHDVDPIEVVDTMVIASAQSPVLLCNGDGKPLWILAPEEVNQFNEFWPEMQKQLGGHTELTAEERDELWSNDGSTDSSRG